MSTIQPLLSKMIMVTSIFLLVTCKKDTQVCNRYTELTDQQHLVDINLLKDVPEFMDTLTKYPHLQLAQVINDPYMIGMHCNVFYKGLKVFTDEYGIFKSKSDDSIFCIDTIVTSIQISLTPTIPFEKAINIAKQDMDFNNTCISYRLGIYNLNAGVSNATKNYKLVWKVQGENGLPYVVIDANNGQVYCKDDGVRI